MRKISQSIAINAPVGRVFEALADPVNQMRYDGKIMRSCEKLTEGSIRRGSRFCGRFKGLGKIEYEYVEFIPEQVIEHAVNMPFGSMRHRFVFVSTEAGTRMTQSISLLPNILGDFLWPLLMKKMMAKRLHQLNASLKLYVEK